MPGYTWASQEGKIENVDSAMVSAFASTPNGDASIIQAWIANGTLEFGGGKHKAGIDYPYNGDQMTAAALSLNNKFYLTQASGEFETRSQQGGVTSFVSGSNGDSASVASQWVWNKTCRPSWVYSDLQATTVQSPSVSVIAAESETDHLRGYIVTTTAENSLNTKAGSSIMHGTLMQKQGW